MLPSDISVVFPAELLLLGGREDDVPTFLPVEFEPLSDILKT